MVVASTTQTNQGQPPNLAPHLIYSLEMYPSVVHLVLAVGAIGVLGHPGAAAAAPAVRFWEETLPDTPLPEVISDLVQKGIDHSPLVEHFPVTGNAVVGQMDYSCRPVCPQGDAGFFFPKTQVRVGSAMSFSLPPAFVPPFLPRDVAEGVPFSDPATVLATFHIAPRSSEAAMVRDTMSRCQASPVEPKQKACTTSLEGTVQSAVHMLGTGSTSTNNGALWAAASAVQSAGLPLRSYVIQAVTTLDGDRHVGCHVMPYPYAVYYCHVTGLPTEAYMVSVHSVSGGGPAVTLAALCHLDTSNWDPAHPALRELHTQPGGVPVCHFMTYANLLFGKKAMAGNP